jgi:phosphoribosyl 1,2-cyclic phosphodiesterase
MLSVCVWGSRGSIPCPGPDTVVYGGNTACLEIRADEKLVIVDLGTGIKPLGDWLMANDFKKGPIDADVFITHTHWDHIMGFPMFTPIFVPTTKLRIRGPVSCEDETLEAIIGNQFSYKYWPVRQSELAARIEYDEIKECSVDLGKGLTVTTKYLNHPIMCLGYRFEYQGKSITTIYDNEPFRNLFPSNPEDAYYDEYAFREGETAAEEENRKLIDFAYRTDLLIHDSQYTREEYEADKIGWGHSSYEHALETGRAAGVKKLMLFHHDPNRTDKQLSALEAGYQAGAKEMGFEVMMARERQTTKV